MLRFIWRLQPTPRYLRPCMTKICGNCCTDGPVMLACSMETQKNPRKCSAEGDESSRVETTAGVLMRRGRRHGFTIVLRLRHDVAITIRLYQRRQQQQQPWRRQILHPASLSKSAGWWTAPSVGLSVFDQPSDDSCALHIRPLLPRSENMCGGDGVEDKRQEQEHITLQLMMYTFRENSN